MATYLELMIQRVIKEKYTFTEDREDIIPCKDVIDYILKDCKIKTSATKIGIEMRKLYKEGTPRILIAKENKKTTQYYMRIKEKEIQPDWNAFWMSMTNVLIMTDSKIHRFHCDALNAWNPEEFNPEKAFIHALHEMKSFHNVPIEKARCAFIGQWRTILTLCHFVQHPEGRFGENGVYPDIVSINFMDNL